MSFRRVQFLAAQIATVALIAVWLPGCDSSDRKPTAALADTVAELTRQSEAWDKAIVQKDKAAIADNMSEDFRQIGSNGDVADKGSFVRDITSDELVIDPYTVEDFNVRVYGDVALLSGRTHMTGHEEGKAFKTQYIYIDVYRRIDGKWKVCGVQTTRLPSKGDA